jgi:two-component system, NarL family, sensor histidine kinase UhpB
MASQLLRLLLVEDSEDDAILLLRMLRRGGYEPSCQRVDTPQAMEAALANPSWDLVIADYVIPGFGGLPALQLLKDRGLDIPFIMVSGQMGEDTAVAAMKAGAHDYLRKDNLVRLVPAIGRELREAEVRRARNQAIEALRESEERFRQLAQNIDVAFFMVACQAGRLEKVVYVSPAYEVIWGRSCQGLYAQSDAWLESVDPADLERVRGGLPRLAQGEFSEEFRIMRPDGSRRWVYYRAFPVRNPAGQVYRVAAIAEDITERKHAEERLAAQTVELQQMVEVLRSVENELRANNAALTEARATLERRVQERTADLVAANADLQREITERRRLENELLDITEKERRRIGIDLHDDLGQHLNGIALLAEALLLKLQRRAVPEVADVERIKTLLHKTMTHAHGMARDLAAVDAKSQDLAAALQGLATHAESLFEITCQVKQEGPVPSLDENCVKQLYKIAQEAVTNAFKHGKATHVLLTMATADGELVLTVRNDGEPFPEALGLSTRMGLRIMNYRAHVIGATVEVKGLERHGTLVTCRLPLPLAQNTAS